MSDISKKSPRSPEELCEIFWNAEKEFKTLEKKIHNLSIWPYIRTAVYYRLSEYCTFFSKHHHPKKTMYCYLKIFSSQLVTFFVKNPFFVIFFGKVDAVIFEHPRSKEINGRVIDIYSYFIAKKLESEGKKIIFIDKSLHGTHAKSSSFRRFNLDNIELIQKIGQKIGSIFCFEKIFFKDEISYFSSRIIGANRLILTELSGAYLHFFLGKILVKLFFKLARPDQIYIVDSYSKRHFITQAAKECNITITELQHGIVSDYHLGYAYPDYKNKSYSFLPDFFRGWEEEWKKSKNAWFNKCLIQSSFEYLFFLKNKYPKNEFGGKRKMVVISQGAIGERLCKEIANRVENLKNYEIFYKLHPGEYSVYMNYSGYELLSKQKNVNFVENGDLYDLFSKSQLVVGVFSTAILEGISFGLRPYLLDIAGIEYMKDRIEYSVIDELPEH